MIWKVAEIAFLNLSDAYKLHGGKR